MERDRAVETNAFMCGCGFIYDCDTSKHCLVCNQLAKEAEEGVKHSKKIRYNEWECFCSDECAGKYCEYHGSELIRIKEEKKKKKEIKLNKKKLKEENCKCIKCDWCSNKN